MQSDFLIKFLMFNNKGYMQSFFFVTDFYAINSVDQLMSDVNKNLHLYLLNCLSMESDFISLKQWFPTFFIWRHTIQLFKLLRHTHYIG